MSGPASSSPIHRFGPYELDADAAELRKRGVRIKLQEQPLQVLILLLSRPGVLITRDELRLHLWPADTFVDFNTGLNTAVMKLRDALDDSAETPRFIETVPRRGYRFIYPLERSASAPNGGEEPRAASHRRRLRWAVVACVVLIAGLVGSMRQRAVRTPEPIRNVALLPFEDLSQKRVDEHFTDGLTEALITELAQIDGLTVIARDSVMRYKGTPLRSSQIARELGVDAVIRGSVIQDGDAIQIRAQLVDPATGRAIWGKSYFRASRDVMTLLGEMAVALVGELHVRLTPELATRLTRARPVDPEANVAYLKGRYHWAKITQEGYRKSLEYFQQAIDLDPNYAPAYSAMGQSYLALAQVERPSDVVPKARAAVDKAISLDPWLAEAHRLRAQLKMRDMAWREAETLFRRALQLNPNDPLAHLHYAAFLNQAGRHEDALPEIRRAEQIDPLSPFVSANVMARLQALGRFEDSLKQAARARELQTDFWLTEQFAGAAYWRLGRTQDAINTWEKVLRLPGAYQAWTLASLTEVYLQEGRARDAEQMLSRLIDLAGKQYVEPVVLARAYAAMHRNKEAMDVLEQGWRSRELEAMRLRSLARFLGAEPRYKALIRSVALPIRED